MMTSVSSETLQNLLETLENEDVADSSEQFHSPSSASEYSGFGNSDIPTLMKNENQYYDPGETDYNISCVPKAEVEDIMVTKIEDFMELDSDCELKRNFQQIEEQSAPSVLIDKHVLSSDSDGVDVQSFSFSMEGKCNFSMTISQPNVDSNQKLSSQNSSALVSVDDSIKSKQTQLSEEHNNDGVTSACSPKRKGTNRKHSPSGQGTTQGTFPKLSKKERSCVFCSKTCVSLLDLQKHIKFHCSFQKRYTVLCKVCGSNWGNRYKAEQHIKMTHNIYDKQKLKSLIAVVMNSKPSSPTVNSNDETHEKPYHTNELRMFRMPNSKAKKQFLCQFCKLKLSSRGALYLHSNYHCHVQKRYELMCKICGFQYASRLSMISHLEEYHDLNRDAERLDNFIIRVEKNRLSSFNGDEGNNLSFRQNSSHEQFLKLSKPAQNKSCHLCKRKFITLIGLQAHSKSHCPFRENWEIKCKLCGLNCGSQFKAAEHIRIAHNINVSRGLKSVTDPVSSNEPTLSITSNNDVGEKCNDTNEVKVLSVVKRRKVIQCKFCKRELSSDTTLCSHCHVQKRFQLMCKICGCKYVNASKTSIITHLVKRHNLNKITGKLRSFVLRVRAENNSSGDKGNVMNSSLGQRMSQDTFQKLSRTEKCRFCKKAFTSLLGLHEHNKLYCPFEEKYEVLCGICGMQGNSRYKVDQHIISKHGINEKQKRKSLVVLVSPETSLPGNIFQAYVFLRPVKEDKVSNSYFHSGSSTPTPERNNKNLKYSGKSPNNVKLRVASKGGNWYCRYCKLKFANFISFQTHLNFHCPSQKKYELVCRICGSRFAGISGLRYHNSQKHGIENIPWKEQALRVKIRSKVSSFMTNKNEMIPSGSNTDASGNTISRSRFKCDHCFRSFTKKKYFLYHRRLCENTRNQNISSNFVKEKEMLKIETQNNRSVSCNVCNKTFRFTDLLIQHLQEHLNAPLAE